MQIPLPGTYPVIPKNWKLSVTRCFFGHFKVESSHFSGLGHCYPIAKILISLFQTSLLDWKCWKIKVKSCGKPPKWPPEGAKKHKNSFVIVIYY
jgi:hypothetical protein